MKLIFLNTIILFAVTVCSQQFSQDQFSFPPQIQKPISSIFTSDSSIYLPPESQTPLPYFSMSDINKIPFHFLPPTGTKAPAIYPTQLPLYMSSTLRFEDDENGDRNFLLRNRAPPTKQMIENNLSRTANNTINIKPSAEKPDAKSSSISNKQIIPQASEIKTPAEVTIRPKNMQYSAINQNPASRRMIVTSEIQRNDQGYDQIKETSFQNPQYVQASGIFISSTTEPAVPILRLSNEMDLDGSFSYEALGADQTHYVQHSRMENMGTDKEEQVVEGSYSYVGDDGRTYTVHYVADSNGFRATGDHLPVPPPVPEIIQRAVQYNLAEEAKRPPHLRSWDNDDKDYEINEQSNQDNSPLRSLYTGKTPEAFSFEFSQGNRPQNTATNFQNPQKSNYDLLTDQSKSKTNQVHISPQITFLASKGAHNPSISSQVSARINNEKSAMPQLMNYEAEIKDIDQESNKALWRWQYGINSDGNQNPKNSISRSFSEGDDVVINFNDMTPEQYTNMIQTQVFSQNAEESNKGGYQNWNRANELSPSTSNLNLSIDNNDNKTFQIEKQGAAKQDFFNEPTNTKENRNEEYHDFNDNNNIYRPSNINNVHSEIISRHNFIPQSKVATQSYNFEDISFEPPKIIGKKESYNDKKSQDVDKTLTNNISTVSSNYFESTTTVAPLFTIQNNNNNFNFNNDGENFSFKPMTYTNEHENKKETTTTEAAMEDMIRENVFLQNLIKPSPIDVKSSSAPTAEFIKQKNYEVPVTTQPDKELKYYQYKQSPENDIKIVKSKPLDINNLLNYVVMKNHFESVKTKQKNKPIQQVNQNFKVHYIPFKDNSNTSEDNEDYKPKQVNDYKPLNQQQHQELQGLIKNYKVLQRQKNNIHRSQLQPEPQKHIKAFHSQSLPPLGRAGPSMKSYLPPTYL